MKVESFRKCLTVPDLVMLAWVQGHRLVPCDPHSCGPMRVTSCIQIWGITFSEKVFIKERGTYDLWASYQLTKLLQTTAYTDCFITTIVRQTIITMKVRTKDRLVVICHNFYWLLVTSYNTLIMRL